MAEDNCSANSEEQSGISWEQRYKSTVESRDALLVELAQVKSELAEEKQKREALENEVQELKNKLDEPPRSGPALSRVTAMSLDGGSPSRSPASLRRGSISARSVLSGDPSSPRRHSSGGTVSGMQMRSLVRASRRQSQVLRGPVFDHFVVVGLAPGECTPAMFPLDGSTTTWKPQMLFQYPQDDTAELLQVGDFCFPLGVPARLTTRAVVSAALQRAKRQGEERQRRQGRRGGGGGGGGGGGSGGSMPSFAEAAAEAGDSDDETETEGEGEGEAKASAASAPAPMTSASEGGAVAGGVLDDGRVWRMQPHIFMLTNLTGVLYGVCVTVTEPVNRVPSVFPTAAAQRMRAHGRGWRTESAVDAAAAAGEGEDSATAADAGAATAAAAAATAAAAAAGANPHLVPYDTVRHLKPPTPVLPPVTAAPPATNAAAAAAATPPPAAAPTCPGAPPPPPPPPGPPPASATRTPMSRASSSVRSLLSRASSGSSSSGGSYSSLTRPNSAPRLTNGNGLPSAAATAAAGASPASSDAGLLSKMNSFLWGAKRELTRAQKAQLLAQQLVAAPQRAPMKVYPAVPVAASEAVVVAPRAYCFLSRLPLYKLHFEVLLAMVTACITGEGSNHGEPEEEGEGGEGQEWAAAAAAAAAMGGGSPLPVFNVATEILHAYYRAAIPRRGDQLRIRTPLMRPRQPLSIINPRLRGQDVLFPMWMVAVTFRELPLRTITTVLGALLMERQVALCYHDLSLLYPIVASFSPLLKPLAWQATFIPLLPCTLLDFLCAPVPFLVGVGSQLHTWEWPDVTFVNVADGKVKQPKPLPPPLPRAARLCKAMAQHQATLRRGRSPDTPPYILSAAECAAVSAILKLLRQYMAHLVGDLRQHCQRHTHHHHHHSHNSHHSQQSATADDDASATAAVAVASKSDDDDSSSSSSSSDEEGGLEYVFMRESYLSRDNIFGPGTGRDPRVHQFMTEFVDTQLFSSYCDRLMRR